MTRAKERISALMESNTCATLSPSSQVNVEDEMGRRKHHPDQRALIPVLPVAPRVELADVLYLLALDASPRLLTPEERRHQFRIVREPPEARREGQQEDALG
jgi:hypothetical protein